LPIIQKKPTIVTVHDLIPIRFPDRFPAGIRGAMKWQIQKIALKNTKRVICDSQSSKEDVVKFVGYDAEHIDVIYLAPSSVFGKLFNETEELEMLHLAGVNKPYMMYVGDVNWNKNIQGLLQAAAIIKDTFKTLDMKLVLVGQAFLHQNLPEVHEINKLIGQLHIEDFIIKAGKVPDDTLAVLYKNAISFLLPSHYEGFGLPVLEAMASGCPVITSDISSLREISGPATLIKPDQIESIAKAMKEHISLSQSQRLNKISRGKDWVKQYSWKKTALETIRSYGKIPV